MMKRLIALLVALLLCLPALAETAPVGEAPDAAELLSPFEIALPAEVTALTTPGGSSVTFVHENGMTRAVAQVLSRVPDPDGDHASELMRLMALYAPGAKDVVPLAMAEGFYGLMALTPDALEGMQGGRIDQATVMVLWQTAERAELLIISAYDLAGATDSAQALMNLLVRAATLDGATVLDQPETAE